MCLKYTDYYAALMDSSSLDQQPGYLAVSLQSRKRFRWLRDMTWGD